MGVQSNKIEREELKPGDHIYSWRTAHLYAHHGIYVGDGMVIHFTRAAGQKIGRVLHSSSPSNTGIVCARCGDQSMLDGVISSCLDCFLSGGNLYIFNYSVSRAFFFAKGRGGTCTLAASDPVADVLYRAQYLLNNGFGTYCLCKNNCENFAIYCKTGIGRSGQIASLTRGRLGLLLWELFNSVGCQRAESRLQQVLLWPFRPMKPFRNPYDNGTRGDVLKNRAEG